MIDVRKGQNLALESVATFGLTLVAALGVVQMFGEVNQGVVSTTEDTQAQVVSNKLRITLLEMESSSEKAREYHQLDLPDKLGGKDYRIAFQQDEILIFTERQNFTKSINLGSTDIDLSGDTDGGSVRIYKINGDYSLRSGR